MSDGTKITWATTTWNPVSGCSPISDGCEHCYARAMAKRLQAMGTKGYERGFEPTFHLDRVLDPLHWTKKPRTVFVSSMGDFFHVEISDDQRMAAFVMMRRAIEIGNRLTFILLTKRPVLARIFLDEVPGWPDHRVFRNFWLGVTAENQEWLEHRAELLLDTPAAHRFVSVEPMLERVHALPYLGEGKVEWVICGGESGPRARPMKVDWARDLLQQCDVAGVPFHLKQYSGSVPQHTPELDGHRYTAMPPFDVAGHPMPGGTF
jgi:protein gp37